mmetsp:Transcript_47124/g.124142  ORF Transcript_47124/g.124142 Transcript_47124/m.124142 type:complete len:318 (+) Transcript_47124:425-1378(+)
MMSLDDGCIGLRVRIPLVYHPHGERDTPPPELRPSPPPIGWSTAFIATPRTLGRRPIQREAPALPRTTLRWLGLLTWPMVARQSIFTLRSSLELILRMAYFASLDWSLAAVPADLTILPPRPRTSSTLCTSVPSGITERGIAFPGANGTSSPDCTVSPTLRPCGARMYAAAPSDSYSISAMKDERFGSYSKRLTTAGSSRVRLKSMTRYIRRCLGAQRPRTVMWPVMLLRPACMVSRSVSAFTGRPGHSPRLSTITRWRKPLCVGLYFRSPASGVAPMAVARSILACDAKCRARHSDGARGSRARGSSSGWSGLRAC